MLCSETERKAMMLKEHREINSFRDASIIREVSSEQLPGLQLWTVLQLDGIYAEGLLLIRD